MKFKEVAHFYIGCKGRRRYDLVEGDYQYELTIQFLANGMHGFVPLLRPMHKLTCEQRIQIWNLETGNTDDADSHKIRMVDIWMQRAESNGSSALDIPWKPATTRYMLSESIDLFGLIASKQALDITEPFGLTAL